MSKTWGNIQSHLSESIESILMCDVSDWPSASCQISDIVLNTFNAIPNVTAAKVHEIGLFIDDTILLNSLEDTQIMIYRKFKRALTMVWGSLEFADNNVFISKKQKLIKILSDEHTGLLHITLPDPNQSYFVPKENGYYLGLVEDFVRCRSNTQNKVICIPNDRGNKLSLARDFFYKQDDLILFRSLNNSINSFYKDWLLIHGFGITVFPEIITSSTQTIISPKSYRTAISSPFENYGICMLCYEVLNAILFLPKTERDNDTFRQLSFSFIRLVSLFSTLYITKHKEFDKIKTAEIASNFARTIERFKIIAGTMLSHVGIFNMRIEYLYIWAMRVAEENIPIVKHLYKESYFKSALMMHQNQTVGGVTNDSLENSYNECYTIGAEEAVKILSEYGNIYSSRALITVEEENRISEQLMQLCQYYSDDNHTDRQITCNNFKCLNRTLQIEPYRSFGNIDVPHYPIYYSYHKLIESMNIDEDSMRVDVLEESENEKIICITINKLYYLRSPTSNQEGAKAYWSAIDKNEAKGIPWISMLKFIVDNDDNLKFIYLMGNNLYPLKKYLNWHSDFFNIPCKIAHCNISRTWGEDNILLNVFGHSQDTDQQFMTY